MGTIIYILISGKLPVTAELVGSGLPSVILYSYGEYSFENVPAGEYMLLLTGDDGCYESVQVVVSGHEGEWVEFICVEVTTTTTTTLP